MASRTWRAISPARAAAAFDLPGQFLLQHLAHQFDARQMLAQAVVQILPDAALLAVADLEDFLFQPFALGDVARHF